MWQQLNTKSLAIFYARYRFFIFPLTVIISSLALIILVLYPQTIKLIANERSLKDLDERSLKLEAKAADLAVIDEKDIAKKIDVALVALPSDQDYPNAIGILQSVVVQSGFIIESFQIGTATELKGAGLPGYGVKLEVFGPKANLNLLLSTIETSSRVMKVSGLDTSSARSGELVLVSLTVDVYYLPASTIQYRADDPLPSFSEGEQSLITSLSANAPRFENVTQPTAPVPKGKSNPFE